MSSIKFTKIQAGKQIKESGLIDDCTFLYTSIMGYQTSTFEKKGIKIVKNQFSTDVVVDEGVVDSLSEKYPEKSIKRVPVSAFEKIYKVPASEIDQETYQVTPNKFPTGTSPADKAKFARKTMECFYVVNFSTNALANAGLAKAVGVNEGDEIPYNLSGRPKAYMPNPLEKGKVIDISRPMTDAEIATLVSRGQEHLLPRNIGNGSKGKLRFVDGNGNPYLHEILVTKLVEYVKDGELAEGSSFGDVTDVDTGRKSEDIPNEESFGFGHGDGMEDVFDLVDELPEKAVKLNKPSPKKVQEEEDFSDDEEDAPKPKPKRKPAAKKPAPKPEPEPEEFDEDEDEDDDLPW